MNIFIFRRLRGQRIHTWRQSSSHNKQPFWVHRIVTVTAEKNFAARPLRKLHNSVNLPNFRQSLSLAAILRDLSTWSVPDINQAGRSKTVRNTYESNSNELYFQFKRQNLKLFVKLTIPMRPFIPTIQTLQLSEFPSSIPPQEITCATQASTRIWSTNQIT